VKTASEMTYTVSGGALNSTQILKCNILLIYGGGVRTHSMHPPCLCCLRAWRCTKHPSTIFSTHTESCSLFSLNFEISCFINACLYLYCPAYSRLTDSLRRGYAYYQAHDNVKSTLNLKVQNDVDLTLKSKRYFNQNTNVISTLI